MVSDIQGSTAKGGMADTIWGLYRERGRTGAKLGITGRDVDERVLELKMDWARGCWQSLGAAHLRLTPVEQEIVDLIAERDKITVNDIAQAVGKAVSNISTLLSNLEDRGFLRRVRTGKQVWYTLSDAEVP